MQIIFHKLFIIKYLLFFTMIDYNYIQQEYTKCYKDKSRTYMIEHYLKTFDATQSKDVPFQLFPRQKDLIATLGKGTNVVTSKPRQAGITTTCAAYIACEMVFADPDAPITVLAIGNTLDLAQQMLFKIRDFLLQFPLWMWGNDFIDQGYDITMPPSNRNIIFNTCNNKELKLKSGSKVVARSSGVDASRGVGGVQYLILDEAAFIESGQIVYTSALPTVSTGGHIIMISTPNGKDQLYYETCRRAKLKGTADWNNFELVEMKWYQDPRYNKHLEWTRKNETTGEVEVITEQCLDDKGNVRYEPEKWAKLDADGWKPRSPWYIKMCRQFNNDSQKIAQELDVSFLGSASNVVEPEFIEMQKNLNQREPIPKNMDCDMFHLDDTWIWKPPIQGHTYICSCLPSGELIKTINGYKKIETITPNDILYNMNGQPEHIIECKRHFINDDIYSVYLSNVGLPMKFTGNHPLFVSDGIIKRWYSKTDKKYQFNERYREHNFQFIDTKDIRKNQWLALPNIYKNRINSDEYCITYMKKYGIESLFYEPLFWWYCGIWAAEGCTWQRHINTTHNISENYITEKISNFIVNFLHKNYSIKTNLKEHSINIAFSHSGLFSFLTENIGQGAKNKFISEFIKCLPSKFRMEFIKGYLNGDGSIYENKRDGILISFGSISYQLLSDIQDILFGEGIISCLAISRKEATEKHFGRLIHCNTLYELKIGKNYAEKFLNDRSTKHHPISNCYFSKDENYIYFKIKGILKENYSGFVYNFETETHTFCANKCITHNCDPSRGDAADRTAIEILDMEGIDEDGKPCLEQVLEYRGKKNGDDIGEILYQYGMLYNNAFIVVDAIGGVGDACLLALMRLGYKNLYYDDANLNKYTMQIEVSSLKPTDGKLPGFHSNAVRFQMLTHFANMVKSNQIKIRSKRVIGELDTWIYKGPAGRIDHQDGAHDDTLTCLAMGIFVMYFSMQKYIADKQKDSSILKAWVTANDPDSRYNSQIIVTKEYNEKKKNYPMPFYSTRGIPNMNKSRTARFNDWLFEKSWY